MGHGVSHPAADRGLRRPGVVEGTVRVFLHDGQLVDRYIVQENPDGTFDYAYGTDQEYGIDYKKG